MKNFLSLLCGCLIAFVVLEVFLRIYHPFEFRVKGDQIILPTNKLYVIENTELKGVDEKIIHKKNSLGFRGEEPPEDFERRLTILTIGGSTTECFYLSDGRAWPAILGKKLKNDFHDVWINNAGLDGHSTFGHLILMQDYVIRLKPKVVIFLVGVNDMAASDPSEYDRKAMMPKFKPKSLKGMLTSLSYKSEAISLFVNLARYLKTRQMRLGHEAIDLYGGNIEIDRKARDDTLDLHKTTYLAGYEKRLKSLIEISMGSGIEPVLMTQSALFGDVIDEATGVNLGKLKIDTMNGSLRWEVLELYNGVTRSVAAEKSVLCIDLAKEMPKDSRYYYDFYHYNNLGAERAAEIIYGHLAPFLSRRYGA